MSDVRWLAVVPDAVTGLPVPVRDADGQELELRAPDRATAQQLARARRLPVIADIRSRVEYEELRREHAAARRRRPAPGVRHQPGADS